MAVEKKNLISQTNKGQQFNTSMSLKTIQHICKEHTNIPIQILLQYVWLGKVAIE